MADYTFTLATTIFSLPRPYYNTIIMMYKQILDMKEGELNILATHLGHDPKTHKEFYRLSSATVELTTVRVPYYLTLSLMNASRRAIDTNINRWKLLRALALSH